MATLAPPIESHIEDYAASRGATALSVVWRSLGDGPTIESGADRSYHAASTMKIAVLVSLLRAVDAADLSLDQPLDVRDRFVSLTGKGTYAIGREKGRNAPVGDAIGGELPAGTLAWYMIVSSSNLATNVLMEWLGTDRIARDLADLDVAGVEVLRGVGDEAAWRAGLNNTATAGGLASILERIATDRAASEEGCQVMRRMLRGQRIRSGIPDGVPATTEVANKTGDISTVVHDAAILTPLIGPPSVLVVMTEWPRYRKGRYATIAGVTRRLLD